MARTKSSLREGLTELDFSSQTRIRAALGDEKAIRAEYSRMRSIIRKRINELEKANVKRNWLYRTFGDMQKQLPTARGMSTRDMMKRMAPMARALSGSYKQTNLRDIRRTEAKTIKTIADQAKTAGQVADAKDIGTWTDAEFEKFKILMGMIENVVGRQLSYDKGITAAVSAALQNRQPGQSLRDMAKKAVDLMGMSRRAKQNAKHSLEFRWTAKGKTKVSWKNRRK